MTFESLSVKQRLTAGVTNKQILSLKRDETVWSRWPSVCLVSGRAQSFLPWTDNCFGSILGLIATTGDADQPLDLKCILSLGRYLAHVCLKRNVSGWKLIFLYVWVYCDLIKIHFYLRNIIDFLRQSCRKHSGGEGTGSSELNLFFFFIVIIKTPINGEWAVHLHLHLKLAHCSLC